MVLLPWLPIELIKENIASIKNDDIITTVIPRKELIEYYMDCSKTFNEQMEWNPKFSEEYEQDENEMLKRLLAEAIEEKKNNNIH